MHMEWLAEQLLKRHPQGIPPEDFFLVVPVSDLIRMKNGEITNLGTSSSLEPVARFFAKNSDLEGIEGVVLTWEFVFNTSLLATKLKEELRNFGVKVMLNTRVTTIQRLEDGQDWQLEVVDEHRRVQKIRSNSVVCCAGCWGNNFDLQAGIKRKWTVSIREMVLIELPKKPTAEGNSDDNYFRKNIPVVYYLDQTSSKSDRIAIIPDPVSLRAKLYAGSNEGYVEEYNNQPIPQTSSNPSLSLPLPTKKSPKNSPISPSNSSSLLPLLTPNSWEKELTPSEKGEAEKQLQKGKDAFPGLLGGAKVVGICYGTTVIVDSKNAMSRSLSPTETDGKGYFSVLLPKAVYAVTLGREVAQMVLERYSSTQSKL